MATRSAVVSRRKDPVGRGGGGENFKVAVRVRPLLAREINSGTPMCVTVDDETRSISISKPNSKRRTFQIGIDDFGEFVRPDTNQAHDFYYDVIFNPDSTQSEIFEVGVKEIVESVLSGYNGSIIASGQTGSGKTYTIEGFGQEANQGVIPRAARMIFEYIESFPNKTDRFLVRVSFLEIYNEKISDLMEPSRENLRIREDGVGGVYIEGLSEHVVRNTGGIMSLLHEGARLRTTGVTKMNMESSRSHAVFTIIVEHGTYDGSGGNTVTIGKLRLVDLAGSERLDVEAQVKQQEETKNINVSLHNFGKVVTALTTPSVKFVPYRDSKLTRILQDCLGGNCKTTLIATITPVGTSYTESLNTLKFAKRAKSIKNTASVNKDMSQKALLSAYEKEIRELKEKLNRREPVTDPDEISKMEREMMEALKEKDKVMSELKVHQKIVTEAERDKNELLSTVLKLEQMLLHGSEDINESAEFKKAVEQEQARIRQETESHYESKLAALESEKKRLEDEKAEVERQKLYFAKLRAEFQPDGKEEVDHSEQEQERGSSPVKRKPRSADTRRPVPDLVLRKPSTAPGLVGVGGHTSLPSGDRMLTSSRRTASADGLEPWVHSQGWIQNDRAPSIQSVQAHVQLDNGSAAALREYTFALAHPVSGIPCQVLNTGVRIFTGSDCVKWFRQNMVGMSSMQQALEVGQRLMDLGVFMEINGMVQFVVSDIVYYQFSKVPGLAQQGLQQQHAPTSRLTSAQSLQFHPRVGSGRRLSIHSIDEAPPQYANNPLSSQSSHSGWSEVSTLSLDQSCSSLLISPSNSPTDLVDHYQLHAFSPTELHLSALYGDRTKLKSILRELSVDCLDLAGHTPLMYAVMGRQTKCCQQLLRIKANVNITNQHGQTPLLMATELNFPDVVRVLLKNGASTVPVNHSGETVYHLAAKLKTSSKCLEYLCKYSSDLKGLNERDHAYNTPLHSAVVADCPDNVTCLLSAKVDLGVSNDVGRTALHYCVTCHAPQCAQAIVEAKPNDVNLVEKENGWSALHLACSINAVDVATILVSHPSCDLNLRDKNGSTPLHLAVHSNSLKVVSLLLSKHVSVNIKDSGGSTALQLGIRLGHNECARLISMEAALGGVAT